MIKNDYYSTSCFNTASVLRYFDIPLLRVDSQGARKFWVFNKDKKTDEVLKKFLSGGLRVELERFLAAQKFMKSTLYNSTNL